MDVEKISIQIYGPRNHLLGHCTVPAADVPQLTGLVEQAKLRQAGYSHASVLRWMVRNGFRSVKHALAGTGQIPVPSGE
jgi:hypothetical protein